MNAALIAARARVGLMTAVPAALLTLGCAPPEAKPVADSANEAPPANEPVAASGQPGADAVAPTGTVGKAASSDPGLPLADIPIPDPPTAEELALLDKDPATLSPEDRRRRAGARYKKVMQDPDSPEARVIRQARAAIEGGHVEGGGHKGPMLQAPAHRSQVPAEPASQP